MKKLKLCSVKYCSKDTIAVWHNILFSLIRYMFRPIFRPSSGATHLQKKTLLLLNVYVSSSLQFQVFFFNVKGLKYLKCRYKIRVKFKYSLFYNCTVITFFLIFVVLVFSPMFSCVVWRFLLVLSFFGCSVVPFIRLYMFLGSFIRAGSPNAKTAILLEKSNYFVTCKL
jgi:hypothetical protein